MKQYKVLKDLINAPVGTILRDCDNGVNTLYLVDNSSNIGRIIDGSQFKQAIDQNFIEPYIPEPKRWRAKNGGSYFIVDEFGNVCKRIDYYETCSNALYNSGNYYKSQATAELVAKAQKLFFEWLHNKEAGWLVNRFGLERDTNLLIAMEEARKAVLEDDSNE